MKREHYFYQVFKPHNPIKDSIFAFGYSLSIVGRVPLEVFIKQRFGVRYLSFANAVIGSFFLALLPFPFTSLIAKFKNAMGNPVDTTTVFLLHFVTWYVFLGFYLYLTWKRRKETRPMPNEFDFSKFSLYSGELVPWAAKLLSRWQGVKSLRTRETLIEPGLFFLAGLALIIIGQYVGWLILIWSIIYAFSYLYAWHLGDEFTWDKSDELILNKNIESAFIQDLDPSFTDNVQFRTVRPKSEAMRREIGKRFVDDDDDAVFVS